MLSPSALSYHIYDMSDLMLPINQLSSLLFFNLQSFVSLNVVSWNIYEEIQLVGLVITETVEHKI